MWSDSIVKMWWNWICCKLESDASDRVQSKRPEDTPGSFKFKYHGFLGSLSDLVDISPGQKEQSVHWFLVTNTLISQFEFEIPSPSVLTRAVHRTRRVSLAWVTVYDKSVSTSFTILSQSSVHFLPLWLRSLLSVPLQAVFLLALSPGKILQRLIWFKGKVFRSQLRLSVKKISRIFKSSYVDF